MNMSAIIVELRKERRRLDEAILALERLSAITGRNRPALKLVAGVSATTRAEASEYSTLNVTATR
jgi:hypothetical protein